MFRTKFCFLVGVMCVFTLVSLGFTAAEDEKLRVAVQNTHFPEKTIDPSIPILIGNNPKLTNLPPKQFPSPSPDQNSTGPPILSGNEENIMEMKITNLEAKGNLTHENATHGSSNSLVSVTSPTKMDNVTKPETAKSTGEEDDMLHTSYKGGKDVDELLKPEKKASEKDDKKAPAPKKDPKSEVITSPHLDKSGPKLMNETKTKSGESVLESTSRVMAVSSSVLASTKPKSHGLLEPAKTLASILLSAVVVVGLGVIGLLVWKRIAMRRFGRDVLINEDDFDEVSDMHTFDRAQIHIT